MVLKVEGGIEKYQDLKRFTASASDISAKDQIDLMSRCWFSLTPNRTDPIVHEFIDLRTKRKETLTVTGDSNYGIATVHDQDVIIFAISQWIEAKQKGLEPSRRIYFTPYQYFAWTNKAPHGTAYARLGDSLHRLKTTNIETTIRNINTGKAKTKQFSWISEWGTVEEDGKVRGVEVVLAEWLFESIQDFHVLTLDKRYFAIPGTVERWLYLYARKASGNANGRWKESFKSLYEKSASQQPYKHYAHTLRKLVEKNNLPGLRLAREVSLGGQDMLLMEQTEKRTTAVAKQEQQLPLIEATPLEEAWENVFSILCKQLGKATADSWLRPLQFAGVNDGVLTYIAPTKFLGDWVQSHYASRLCSAWEATGHEVKALAIETRRK